MMKKILLAFQFLTIIPVQDMGEVSEEEMGRTTAVFPVVGIIEGGIFLILSVIFLKILSPEITSLLLITIMVLMNGALHIDGLADTFDAIASRGDREKRLSIMKDSALGVAGTVAIVLDLLLRYVLLNALLSHPISKSYYAVIFLLPVMARWTMVPVALYGKSAREEGLGRLFAEYTKLREMLIATGVLILSLILVFIVTLEFSLFGFYCMAVFPVLYGFGLLAVWFFNKTFGGLTGDSFGAVYEISILLVLLMSVIWLQDSI